MTQAARIAKVEEMIHQLESTVEKIESEIKNITIQQQQNQHNFMQRIDLLQMLVTQWMQKQPSSQPSPDPSPPAPAPAPAATNLPSITKETETNGDDRRATMVKSDVKSPSRLRGIA
jgi:TolA-binding protein